MAKTKRPIDATAEATADAPESTDEAVPSKKRPKSEKPMERKKKRKELDKVRHRTCTGELQNKTSVAEPDEDRAVTASASSSDNVLPEFHISVFGDLASSDGSKRFKAVETLVRELEEVQKAYEGLGRKEGVEGRVKLEAEKDDGLDDCAPSVRYAVRRLIRGVSSSRECARQGFALGLTLLVGAVPSIRVDSVMKLTNSLLEVSSSMKGQEARDCLLGQLFVYGALARSGRLSGEWANDKSTPHIKEFTSQLVALSAKKRYLQEPAVHVLLDLIDKLPSEALKGHVVRAPGVHEWFEGAAESGNPDALLLALRIQEKISGDSSPFGKLLPNPFSASKFFASEHLSSLMNCLKESTFSQPRVHTVWPVLARILLPDSVLPHEDTASITDSLKKQKKGRKGHPSEEETAKNLRNFVEVVIDGSLMSSSHDRKHLAFDILLSLIPKVPASLISHVLTYKLVRCLVDVLSTKDSWLYKIAENFLQKLSDWVKDDDVRRVGVVVSLQRHSNGKFDIVTRTKTVKTLMSEFQAEPGCMLFIQSLTSMFVDEGPVSDEPSDQSQTTDDNSELGSTEDKDSVSSAGNVEYLKSWVVESIPGVLKHLKLDSEAKFRVQKVILKFLAVQGLFTASLGSEVTSFELHEKFRWPKAVASSALCGICIKQLQSVLASSQKGEGPRASLNSSEQNDLGSFFVRFFCTLRSIPSVSLFRALSDDDKSALEKLQETESMLSREERSCDPSVDVHKLHALRYLLIQLLLQVLLRPGQFSEAASELATCCKKLFSSSYPQDSSREDEVNGDGAPELMDVLVDTLLSLLPQSSAPLRSVIEPVFKYFCSEITDEGLRRMMRVIKKDLTPPRHVAVGSEDESDDEQDEDFLDIKEDEEVEDADMDKTVENDEITDDSETAAALAENNREITENSDSDSNSDEGMDDEAMLQMDTYLAQIFKERKYQSGSSGAETAQSQLVLFKLRVLSLLEIHLHENPGKSQLLTVFSNLAQTYVNLQNTEGSGQLGERIWVILQKKVFKAKEYPKGDDVELSTIETLLEKSLKWASKPFKRKTAANPSKEPSASLNRHKMIVSLAQKSTLWLLKILDGRKFEESKLERVREIFRGVLVGYFDSKKSQIKSEFLKEILKRRPWIGRDLFGFVLEKCGTTKSEFRRVEALDLISEILKQFDERQLKPSIKNNLSKLSCLIEELAKNAPKKQARRADVRKFCGRVFSIISNLNLKKPFLKGMSPEAQSTCESQLGDIFLNFKNTEK